MCLPLLFLTLSRVRNVPTTVDFDVAETLLTLDNDSINEMIERHPCTGSLQYQSMPSLSKDIPRRARSCSSSANQSTSHSSSVGLGPTSQSHLRLSGNQLEQVPSKPDELAEFGFSVGIKSAQVRNRLLQSFFTYQALWVGVVDQDLFDEYRKDGKSSMWYSNFLESVMLACAARLSTSSAVRFLAEEFSKQAKEEIPLAVETPSAASMQGFMLLSEYEVSCGRDRCGWMLCGICPSFLL